ncbi:uncharacterized protein LODBEIA_P26990 [Lodderomyces beijingensis]|uniref:Uncharacterized protein n=1 Tax=Lodderomyces beijingensis TaxID=1775926 RepID=A0ABP0ZQJ2_9ASCO
MQFKSLAAISALSAVASATNFQNATVITTDITVTAYTTYCPEPTTITLTVCDESAICKASEIVVAEAQTITITEDCVIPVSYTTAEYTITKTLPCVECAGEEETVAPVAEEETIVPVPEVPAEETVAPVPAPADASESYAPIYEVTSYEGAAGKNVAGLAAGFLAVAAAFL